MKRSNKKVKAAVLEVVDNQLRDNTPPETRKTYQRLLQEGFSDRQARELIGVVVSSEIFEVLKKQQPYDQERFVAALERLPQMPWE
jgi:hypothetical protein